ncbi:MAG: VWA domain-containing protein [bacterium]|nr:VWA domain-containing protein [bacterium]
MKQLPVSWTVAFILSVSPGLAGQDRPTPADPGETFVETVEVNVVNVEVIVTDKKGTHVGGLTRDDFEIYEDGRQVEVTNFYARETEDQAGPATAAAPPVQPAVPERDKPRPVPRRLEDQRLHLVVFIDNFNVRPLDRNRVLGRVRTFLFENVEEGDQVMLVSYDRFLKVERPFTGDIASIAEALVEMESTSGHLTRADAERRDLLDEIENSDAGDTTQLIHRIRQHAQSVANDLSFTIDALKNFIGPLSGLPGRKAILHVSDGFPMIPAQELFYAVQQRSDDVSVLSEVRAFDASRRIQELAATANANRVTFYAIDASGLRTYGADAIQRKGGGWETIGPDIDALHVANLQSPIRFLADTTGGLAVVNTNDVGPGLRRIAGDFTSYYSLGFRPAHASDGRFHKIEVRVRREDLRVRHREGYRSKSVENHMVDGTTSALLYGVDSNPVRVGVDLGAQRRREDGLYLVTLLVRVPFDEVVLIPQGGEHRARVRVFISAMDEEGGISPVEQAPIPIRIPSEHLEAALEESLVYETQLVMRPGRHKVAIGLRDDLGHTSSFVSRYLVVGEG